MTSTTEGTPPVFRCCVGPPGNACNNEPCQTMISVRTWPDVYSAIGMDGTVIEPTEGGIAAICEHHASTPIKDWGGGGSDPGGAGS
jgi:hypothetical protein